MSTTKTANVTVTLDEETLSIFREASEIVEKAGIRVPTAQLVQTMINAESQRLSPRKVAQRFLKSIMEQIGGVRGSILDDEEEENGGILKPTTVKS